MPFKAPDVAKCPKCGKSVYAAEEMLAANEKWHKGCFKCNLCNKKVDSLNVNHHENEATHIKELFCKQCYQRKYGPKGNRQGTGISMDVGAHLGGESSVTNKPAGIGGNLM